MTKRRASSKISTNVRRHKLPRLVKNTGIEKHVPCKTCSDLNPDLFKEIAASVTTNLAKVKESKESGCQFCRVVYETYNHYYQADDDDWPDFRFTMEFGSGMPVEIVRRAALGVRYPIIKLYSPIGSISAWETLGPHKNTLSEPGSNESFALQKMWMENCLQNHKKCHLNIQKQMPNRLVHVGRDDSSLRLIEVQGIEMTYIALSHCWGDKQPLLTTSSTIELRKESLDWDLMPATFQDAIRVTRSFGIRYLWIDSLCIIQDDTKDWETEAAKMADVYEGAELVIAASSSSNPMTPFLTARTTVCGKPLELDLKFERQQGDVCKVKARPVITDIPQPLDERAWTFQEQQLARRLLQFQSGELRWRCREERRCECQDIHLSTRISYFGEFPEPEEGADQFRTSWHGVAESYSRRQITRMSDKLPALSGLATRVSSKTGSEYIAGLWKDSLLYDLQWSTVSFVTEEEYPLLRASWQYLAPTFSWMSVPGEITYRLGSSWESNDDIVKAKVCDVKITHKGINLFGEVLDGFAILDGPLISATLSDRQSKSDPPDEKTLFYNLKYGSKVELGYMDLPPVIGTAIGVAGMISPTAKRSSEGDVILPLENAPVWCLGITMGPEKGFALILGLSSRIPGAYERLGAFTFRKLWFENVSWTTVKIV